MKKHRKFNKNEKCSYSGKCTKNKEVILLEFAVDYVRKMGFYVSDFKIK